MRFLNSRLKKIVFWIFVPLIVFVALVIAFISPIARWAIQKYDTSITGREITLDRAYVNPFTGFIYLKNPAVYEAGADTVFFSAKSLSVNFEVWKLFSKMYEISSLTLNEPVIRVVQSKKEFNFDDMVRKFSAKDTMPREPKEPAHFNALNMSIKNGTFYYAERSMGVSYFIKQVNIETPGKRWNSDTLAFRYSFVSGIGSGGSMKGTFDMNTASLNFRLTDIIRKFDISILEQYVNDIANYGHVRGNLDADLEAAGNFKATQNLFAKGPVAINDFHFGKNEKEDYLAFKKLAVDIVQLSPQNKKYFFDSVFVLEPYFKYERYDSLDNLQDMFGKKGEKAKQSGEDAGKVNILFKIGNYVAALAKNFFKSDYQVKRLGIYRANIRYNDYSLNEKFAAAVSPLTVTADSIERGDKWVNLNLRTGIKPYGNFALNLSINPKDSSDFTFNYKLRQIPLAMFNPYFVTYTSFPLDRGILEFTGHATVMDGVINCNNHLVIIDPRVNNKQRRNGARWLPMRLFMFLVRERGNVIDYEIPIKGNLKDPNFKYRDVILDILRNIFVKPVTTPYRVEVKNVENEIEKSLTLKWVMRSNKLNPPQEKFIEQTVDFLREHPEAVIQVSPELYGDREREYILFFEAKKKHYLLLNKLKAADLSEKDSARIEKIAVKDPAFVAYLNRNGGQRLHTVQEKCSRVIGSGEVSKKLKALNRARHDFFMSFFQEKGVQSQVRFKSIKDTVPFNGFSQYRINYKGDFPDKMLEAYERINDLDNNSPRNKFKDERAKNRKLLDAK